MSVYRIATQEVTFEIFAADELDALEQSVDTTLLRDGDEGNVEKVSEVAES